MAQSSPKSAVKPDVFLSFSEVGQDKRPPKEKQAELDPDDVALSGLSKHDGWYVLNEYIEGMKKEMDELIKASIANGSDFEAVGRLTVVANLAKEKLYAVQKRVQDAREVGDRAGV